MVSDTGFAAVEAVDGLKSRTVSEDGGAFGAAANYKGRRRAPFPSAVIGGVVAECGHDGLRVDDDHGDGARRQNEGDGRKCNELVQNRLLSKLIAVAGSNITGTASRKT